MTESGITITDSNLNKESGDSSKTHNSEFYGVNAAVLVNGGELTISGGKITTAAKGANAVVATKKGNVTITDTEINSTATGSARGLHSTHGGKIEATNVKISTTGKSCATLATDRGEGIVTCTECTLSTAGAGSPLIYSTGDITVSKTEGTATGAQAVVVEGKNVVTVKESSNLKCNGNPNRKNVDQCGVMLYQSMSGDAKNGTGIFNCDKSTIEIQDTSSVYSTAPMFFVTNTQAEINLEECTFKYGSGIFLKAEETFEWGKRGANGGVVTLTLTNQDIEGDFVVDANSGLIINLVGASIKGKINEANTAAKIEINLDALVNEKTDGSNLVNGTYNWTSFTEKEIKTSSGKPKDNGPNRPPRGPPPTNMTDGMPPFNSSRPPHDHMPPFNSSRPPFNSSRPPHDYMPPFNSSRPPFNSSRLECLLSIHPDHLSIHQDLLMIICLLSIHPDLLSIHQDFLMMECILSTLLILLMKVCLQKWEEDNILTKECHLSIHRCLLSILQDLLSIHQDLHMMECHLSIHQDLLMMECLHSILLILLPKECLHKCQMEDKEDKVCHLICPMEDNNLSILQIHLPKECLHKCQMEIRMVNHQTVPQIQETTECLMDKHQMVNQIKEIMEFQTVNHLKDLLIQETMECLTLNHLKDLLIQEIMECPMVNHLKDLLIQEIMECPMANHQMVNQIKEIMECPVVNHQMVNQILECPMVNHQMIPLEITQIINHQVIKEVELRITDLMVMLMLMVFLMMKKKNYLMMICNNMLKITPKK